MNRGPLNGFAIAECIHKRSHDVLAVEEGSLCPALYRMERKGLQIGNRLLFHQLRHEAAFALAVWKLVK